MKTLFILLVSTLFITSSFSQDENLNLPDYENKPMHFGFGLSLNSMHVTLPNHDNLPDTMAADYKSKIGFGLEVLYNQKINTRFDLRIVPGLHFGEKQLLLSTTTNPELDSKIETIYLSLPVLVKYKLKRFKNFRPYLMGGASFMYDLAAESDHNLANPITLKREDFHIVFGTGFEFYLPYFKLALELKASSGLNNLLNSEKSIYSNIIDEITSQMFTFGVYFE